MRSTAVLILVILLAPALAGTVMPVAQEPLAADLNNAIELWSGIVSLIKSTGSQNTLLRLTLDSNTVAQVREWDGAYIVLTVPWLDTYKGNHPFAFVQVRPATSDITTILYKSELISVAVGHVQIYVPKYIWQNTILDNGALIDISLYVSWAPDTTDSQYGFRITQVLLAPPEGTQDNTQAEGVGLAAFVGTHAPVVATAIAIALSMVAIALIVTRR